MQSSNIDSRLTIIEQAIAWENNVPEASKLSYREKLVKIRRELKKIKFAIEERPSTAAFGESQMGKSYLVSAMLSTPDKPFCVNNGFNSYNFIDEINPSSPNSTIEATGVITRFTTSFDRTLPEGYLKAQLLSIPDIILMLCEAFYNQIDYSNESVYDKETINEALQSMPTGSVSEMHKILDEDDVSEIEEYLRNNSIKKKIKHILDSNIFKFMLMNASKLANSQIVSIAKLLWNNNIEINKLFDDLLRVYAQLDYCKVVYAPFEAVLKKHGTLLDVARLDEMYGMPEAVGTEYKPDTTIIISGSNQQKTVKKSFLSALTAELCFTLPTEITSSREFLNQLDILDFPGARRPEQIKDTRLSEGKNLSTVLRRGKVTYLFNKYSKAKRISTLLFCHNNNQSAESTMGGLLTEWVSTNIGENDIRRNAFVQQSKLSPLFIIGTWFNKDLEYQNEAPGDVNRLNERWQRRFNVVLEKEVLKSLGDDEHWFNKWTTICPAFQNIYMLRDFKYSKTIFNGYDPDTNSSETSYIFIEKYPDFIKDLKYSFTSNPFVTNHFSNPSSAWDESATVGNDGTHRIISSLNDIAPNINNARDDKFTSDFRNLDKELRNLLEQYYHPESSDEQLKKAKRMAGATCSQIDIQTGKDPYFFGRLIDSLMITESSLYEAIHHQVLGGGQTQAISGAGAQIFMMAGLSTSVSREENIERLCDYFGVYDEEECEDVLKDQGLDMETILSQCKMVSGESEQLLDVVEQLWHDEFLCNKCVEKHKDNFSAINTIVSNLWTLYKMLGMHEKLNYQVKQYLNSFDKEVVVGILADYLSMALNKFVSSFGYDYMDDKQKNSVIRQNELLRLRIEEQYLEDPQTSEGIDLLGDLFEMKEQLSGGQFGINEREMAMRFPQYRQSASWAQRLRLAYVYACSLPDYDIKANTQLGKILEQFK